MYDPNESEDSEEPEEDGDCGTSPDRSFTVVLISSSVSPEI